MMTPAEQSCKDAYKFLYKRFQEQVIQMNREIDGAVHDGKMNVYGHFDNITANEMLEIRMYLSHWGYRLQFWPSDGKYKPNDKGKYYYLVGWCDQKCEHMERGKTA